MDWIKRQGWAPLLRSPPLPLKNVPQLFLFIFFRLLIGFLLLSFVFILFSAFVSHGVPPFSFRLTVFP